MSGKTIQVKYNDREVSLKKTYDEGAQIWLKETSQGANGQYLFAYLTPENAYEIHDWIAENIERPRRKTAQEQFDEFPVPTSFSMTDSKYIRVKVSDTHYFSGATNKFHHKDDLGSIFDLTEVKVP